jgi:hypothetical protein
MKRRTLRLYNPLVVVPGVPFNCLDIFRRMFADGISALAIRNTLVFSVVVERVCRLPRLDPAVRART